MVASTTLTHLFLIVLSGIVIAAGAGIELSVGGTAPQPDTCLRLIHYFENPRTHQRAHSYYRVSTTPGNAWADSCEGSSHVVTFDAPGCRTLYASYATASPLAGAPLPPPSWSRLYAFPPGSSTSHAPLGSQNWGAPIIAEAPEIVGDADVCSTDAGPVRLVLRVCSSDRTAERAAGAHPCAGVLSWDINSDDGGRPAPLSQVVIE